MPQIYLIRHGENDLVKEKRLAGRLPGIHLNDRGRQQAATLAVLLGDLQFHAIVSSPLERAMETARPLAKRCSLPVTTHNGLIEFDYGSWQGKTLKALRRRKLWPLVQQHPSRMQFPNGESFLAVQTRAVAAIETILRTYPEDGMRIACFSHSDVIKLILASYIGLPVDLLQRLQVAPASVSILSLTGEHVRLVTMNDQRATQSGAAL